jgi:hypothetical protein
VDLQLATTQEISADGTLVLAWGGAMVLMRGTCPLAAWHTHVSATH